MNDVDLFRYLVDGASVYTLETIALNMAVTTLLGMFIFFVYKKTFTGVLYSLGFNVSIVAVAMITAMVIMLIGSNLAISLGMVGALPSYASAARSRNPVISPSFFGRSAWGFRRDRALS
jgi:hypothetical protein